MGSCFPVPVPHVLTSQDPLPLIKKKIRELPTVVYFREFSLSQIAFVFCFFSE